MLHELAIGVAWQSLEVFAPILRDPLCEMMPLHGMAFARQN